jgi:hypothetical protein
MTSWRAYRAILGTESDDVAFLLRHPERDRIYEHVFPRTGRFLFLRLRKCLLGCPGCGSKDIRYTLFGPPC